jgi:exonuclease VII small subunit
LENKKKCAAQLTQVISSLEGKISRLDQRSLQVVTDCQDLLNNAIETLVEILQF